MNDRYLTAVIRIPIRLSLEGGLTLMNEYSKITIENIEEDLTKTGDTVYGKVVEYLESESHEDTQKEEEVLQKEEEVQQKEEEVQQKEEEVLQKEEEVQQKEEEVLQKEEEVQQLYKFPYLKKSKKPLNATFRARVKTQNFTKKVYSH